MHAFRFPKEARLRQRKEFLSLSKKGARVANEHFIAVVCASPKDTARLGITVTKKVGGACVRNRLKRRAREYFRLHKHCLGRAYDINIIARNSAARLGSKETYAALEKLFNRMAQGAVS